VFCFIFSYIHDQLVSVCYESGFPGMKPQFITLHLWSIRIEVTMAGCAAIIQEPLRSQV